jgi:hypothetical protein
VALRFEDHAGFQRACLLAAAGGALGASYATWMLPPARLVPWAAAGAAFALAMVLRWQHEIFPPVACIAAAVALAAGAVLAAGALPALAELLETLLPPAGAAGVGGAVLGLWLGAATAPLHLRSGGLENARDAF